MGQKRIITNGDTLDLAVGTVLKFSEGAVEYTVSAIDTSPSGTPRITLERTCLQEDKMPGERQHPGVNIETFCPKTLTWEAKEDKTLPVGRDMGVYEQDGLLIPDSLISRAHGTIRYSKSGERFQYYHNGRNSLTVDEPVEKSRDHAPSAINTITSPQDEKKQNLMIPLPKGTSIAFHRNTPTYKVIKADIGKRRLVLRNMGGPDSRYPNTIEINDEHIHTLGSAPDRNIRFNNKVISAHQGIVHWSDRDHNFVYECMGRSVPVVHASEALVAEQEKICRELKPGPALAREQLREVDDLLGRIEIYQRQLNDVQDLEWSIIGPGRVGGWLPGGKTEDSQIGYALWLESLSALYNEKLAPEEKQNIAKMAGVLRRIADDRAELRDIEQHCSFPLKGEHKERLEKYVARKAAELESNGEVYLVSGFRGHHTISRIREEGGQRRLTVYNAGAEAVPVQVRGLMMDNMVLGMYEHDLKPDTDVKELIRLLSEKKIRGRHEDDYYDLFKKIQDCLNPEVGRHRVVPPQTRGNCTTRSTRHALEDALGDNIMAMFGRVIADPEVSAAEDIKEALEMRKRKLQSLCGMGTGADQRINRADLGDEARGA